MKKTVRKMTLSRETLRVLDRSDLKGADGAALPGGSFDPTCMTRCFICPVTRTTTIETGTVVVNE
jgi:hypothetical protein